MRITYKIGLMAAVPLVAAAGFGATTLDTTLTDEVQARHLGTLIDTVDVSDDLVHQLQVERTVTATYLTAAGSVAGATASAPTDDLVSATAYTDAAVARYRTQKPSLDSLPGTAGELVRRIDSELTSLPALRARVRSTAGSPALSAVVFQYHGVIADLLAFRDDVAQSGSAPPAIAAQLRLSGLLDQAAEYAGQEQARVNRITDGAPLTPAAQQDIALARAGYTTSLDAFLALAPSDWRQRPTLVLTGPMIEEARRLEDAISRLPIGAPVQIDQRSWTVDMSERIDRLQSIQREIDARSQQAVDHVELHQEKLAAVEGVGVLGAIAIAVFISFRLGRPMIRGLRSLRDGAHLVAYERLPASVEKLRVSGPLTEQTPEQVAAAAGQAVQVSGTDEIAAVAKAFNTVHTEAVRIAAEQALLRAGVGRSFVALARRGERLTGALTMELDRAERAEQDPDRLARLFTLDHLAARMSRNNESLLVLGGEGTVRIRESAVPMLDVVRAALGRIDKYARVVPRDIDPSVAIAAEAADHLVHLLAELLDNATAFSPPKSEVTVDARRMADRVILQIVDHGIGLKDELRAELNGRLATPRTLDVAAVQAMGLTVVARLASWYGIDVELRPGQDRGTIAEVTLPPLVYRVVAPSAGPAEEVLSGSGSHQLVPMIEAAELVDHVEIVDRVELVEYAEAVPAQPQHSATPPERTESGLPKRVPLARLPDTALARKSAARAARQQAENQTPETGPAAPDLDERDPAEASAAMAAFARGIGGGHGADEPNRFPETPKPSKPSKPSTSKTSRRAKRSTR